MVINRKVMWCHNHSVFLLCGGFNVFALPFCLKNAEVGPVLNYALHHGGVWGLNVQIHVFLTLDLVGGKWSVSPRGCFTLGERASSTDWIGGWVGHRTSLGHVNKIFDPIRTWTPTHTQTKWGLNKLQKPKKEGLIVDTGLHLPEIMKCSHVKTEFF
jgi:hypothetical protein